MFARHDVAGQGPVEDDGDGEPGIAVAGRVGVSGLEVRLAGHVGRWGVAGRLRGAPDAPFFDVQEPDIETLGLTSGTTRAAPGLKGPPLAAHPRPNGRPATRGMRSGRIP